MVFFCLFLFVWREFYLLRDAEALPGHGTTPIETDDAVHSIPDLRDILGELEIDVDLAKLGGPLDVVVPLQGDLNGSSDSVLLINLFVIK